MFSRSVGHFDRVWRDSAEDDPMTTVSYDQRAVQIDGERTLLLSGAIHYPRSTPAQWDAMMARSRAAGLNVIETYVFWGLHERERGVFDFSGRLDLPLFCRTAQKHGLHVILRIGPYICAEINYGGFPAWLRDLPGIQLRTLNQPYMDEMEQWVRALCARMEPYFAPNGGPIIMAQIENEYNLIAETYGEQGQAYLAWSIHLGQSLELGVPWVMCVGGMPGAIETINGFYGHTMIDDHQAKHPDQPLIWTENWPGWYDIWQRGHHIRTPENVAYGVARFIAAGGTGVNYYMWHGGTNFGRDAMYLQTTSYDYDAPLDEFGFETTKSNHCARLHATLLAQRAALLTNPRATPTPLGEQQAAYAYGDLVFLCNDDTEQPATVSHAGTAYTLAPRAVLLLAGGAVLFDTAQVAAADTITRVVRPAGELAPFTFRAEPLPGARAESTAVMVAQPVEQLQLTRDRTDYCWYLTHVDVPDAQAGAGTLTLSFAADLVYVYVDGVLAAHGPARLDENRSRTDGDREALAAAIAARHFAFADFTLVNSFAIELPLTLGAGSHEIAILACALGMVKGDWQIGFENMAAEKKGLWGPVFWRSEALPGPWQLVAGLAGEQTLPLQTGGWQTGGGGMGWYRSTFARPATGAGLVLDLQSMTKGMAWLNGQCIGRYWLTPAAYPGDTWLATAVHEVGMGAPTQRYYHLPAEWLQDDNVLVLFEEQGGDPAQVQLARREEA